jgi:hypothetical protein
VQVECQVDSQELEDSQELVVLELEQEMLELKISTDQYL